MDAQLELTRKVRDKGLRMTKQRDIILEELRKVKSHPNADEIYHLVRYRIPNISFGTVYRNLRILKELGEILELDYGKNFSRFDGNPINHYHFACEECGRVFDVDMPVDSSLDETLSKKTGFHITYHRTEFYGICPECEKLKKQLQSI
jgi:Fur family peroxide stress response transcriptional regulator